MRGRWVASAVILAVGVAGCATDASRDSDARPAKHTATPEASSAQTEHENASALNVRWLGRTPSGIRPDCTDGQVTHIAPGHSGWRSLERAAAGLLRHPGADHAAILPVNIKNARAVVVLYRKGDTTKATARLRRLHGRWFPSSIALCRGALF